MNIAEIRKKSKKKKEQNKTLVDEQSEIMSQENTEIIPLSSKQEVAEYKEEKREEIEFIDEENLYRKYSVKDTKELTEFLCFKLGEEEYAIDVRFVKEIIKNRPITEVPKTLDFILGVISIRGDVMPVFDIKKLLDISSSIDSITSKIVIIEFGGERLSLVVDAITQIARISVKDITPAPMNISGAKQEFIKGVTLLNDRMIRMLDIEKILNF